MEGSELTPTRYRNRDPVLRTLLVITGLFIAQPIAEARTLPTRAAIRLQDRSPMARGGARRHRADTADTAATTRAMRQWDTEGLSEGQRH